MSIPTECRLFDLNGRPYSKDECEWMFIITRQLGWIALYQSSVLIVLP